MTSDELKLLLAALAGDTALREAVQNAHDAKGVVEVAQKAGFKLQLKELEPNEISDIDLESLSGGFRVTNCNKEHVGDEEKIKVFLWCTS